MARPRRKNPGISRQLPKIGRLSPEVALARCAMIRMGLRHEDIARSASVSSETVTNWLSSGFAAESTRWKFEAALDYREPIWSRPAELKLRRHCVQTLGFDPFLMQRVELAAKARSLGLRVLRDDRHAEIRRTVMKHLAATLVAASNQSPQTKRENHP